MVSLREQLTACVKEPEKVQALLELYWETVSRNPNGSYCMGCFIQQVKGVAYNG